MLLIVCGSASIAESASITSFSERNNFNTAVGATPLIVEDFTESSHYPISTGILNSQTNLDTLEEPIRPGDIEPGATYSTPVGTGSFFNIIASPEIPGIGGFTGGFLNSFSSSTDPDRTLTVDFDNNVSAFGFDTNSFMGDSFNLTINFASRGSFVGNFLVNNSARDLQFFGFQSDATDIQSINIDGIIANDIGNSSYAFAVDNFTYTAVPEPFTAGAPVIAGCIGLWLKRKKRKGSQSV